MFPFSWWQRWSMSVDSFFMGVVTLALLFSPSAYYFTLGGEWWILGPLQFLFLVGFILAVWEVRPWESSQWPKDPVPFVDEEEE